MEGLDWLFIDHLIRIFGALFAVWWLVAALVLLIGGWHDKQ